MYHDLPRTARFWSFLFAIDQDLAEKTRKQRVSVRRTPALRQLPPQATGHSRPASRATAPQTELLLRSRRLQEESDTAVGTLPRPKGLPRRHRHPDQRHAARADTTPCPRALQALRRRPTDHRSLAGLLARTLSADTILEGRTRPVWCRLSRSSPCPTRSWTPSSAAIRRCRGWTLLLRFLSPITIPGALQIEVSR